MGILGHARQEIQPLGYHAGPFHSFIHSFYNSIYLFDARNRRHKEAFHLLVHSPNGCNSPCWAGQRQKLRAPSWLPTQVAGPQIHESCASVFPGDWQGVGAIELNPKLHYGMLLYQEVVHFNVKDIFGNGKGYGS